MGRRSDTAGAEEEGHGGRRLDTEGAEHGQRAQRRRRRRGLGAVEAAAGMGGGGAEEEMVGWVSSAQRCTCVLPYLDPIESNRVGLVRAKRSA